MSGSQIAMQIGSKMQIANVDSQGIGMSSSRLLFGCTIFLASFLLFLVEPMAAKQLLPVFGGSAAVWITCLVFFQTALLAAYSYAHWITRRPVWNLHITLLFLGAASALIWTAHTRSWNTRSWNTRSLTGAAAHPFLGVLSALAVSIGLPFLMLGATSPLLQVWLARIETGRIPYRLFALSNLASLLALAAYPTLIEPNLTLRAQRTLWGCGFAIFAALSATLAFRTRQSTAPAAASAAQPGEAAPATPLSRKLLWLLLPMAASMQLAAVTSHITQNIAPIPLLWILPLGVYLITLILAFEFPRILPRWLISRLLIVLLAALAYWLTKPEGSLPLKLSIGFFLTELFVACQFCHAEAYALKPERPSESTLFYLMFAAGGALGSFLIGIVAPSIFSFNYDLSASFFVTAAVALAAVWPEGWQYRLVWSSSVVLTLVLCILLRNAFYRDTPIHVRNFYGSLRVKETVGYPGAAIHVLTNGTIQHGTQIFSDALRTTPTTYYARDSGVGIAVANCCLQNGSPRARNIGVIGLGAGTMAAYGESGDHITFYEINPAVIPIAENVFTYIHDAQARGARVDIVEGDARNSLAAESPQRFDVLVVDAFSGDAIPLHLLTTEAVALYKKHLAPGGVLAFHISNQHVDLEPEVLQLAKASGMQARVVSTRANEERGEFIATWMLVSADAGFFNIPAVFNASQQPSDTPHVRVWTDDYSSLLPILDW